MSNETKHPDYTFTDDNAHKERSVIQINEGDYEGMKFVFGGIKFVALEGDEENMGLNFTKLSLILILLVCWVIF